MNLIEWQVKLFNDFNISTPPVSVNKKFVIVTAEKPEEISSNSVLFKLGGLQIKKVERHLQYLNQTDYENIIQFSYVIFSFTIYSSFVISVICQISLHCTILSSTVNCFEYSCLVSDSVFCLRLACVLHRLIVSF